MACGEIVRACGRVSTMRVTSARIAPRGHRSVKKQWHRGPVAAERERGVWGHAEERTLRVGGGVEDDISLSWPGGGTPTAQDATWPARYLRGGPHSLPF